MPTLFPLQQLLDLAQQRSEDAALVMLRLKQAWLEAQSKLEQLETYLVEYRLRLQESTLEGLSIIRWRDYQAFIGKLEVAIKAQHEEVERCRLRWEQGQSGWQACEREVKAYSTLRERHHKAEQIKEVRLDQRQQDEFARNQHHRKSHQE